MDLAGPNHGFGIFQIYKKYCDIVSRNAYACVNEGYREENGSQNANLTRGELAELLKAVHSCVYARTSIYDQLQDLMSLLGVMADFSEFSRFYDFVFFMCRENGQKNIAVTRAISAWKLVLAGRFRLLNRWCEFVQKNQRHNISEDTWRQVLAFSRCVHENLEVYDPEGAWPVLIDDFVEYMYRVNGTNDNFNVSCNCGYFEAQTSTSEDPLPGLKLIPGLKRKMIVGHELKSADLCSFSADLCSYSADTELIPKFKRLKQIIAIDNHRTSEGKSPGLVFTDALDITKQRSPLKSTNSPCAVEGCLSKGFAGLFSTASRLQVDRKSYT